MLRNLLLISAALFFASSILATSIMRSAKPNYTFYNNPKVTTTFQTNGISQEKVEYYLPYPGMLPDHFLWPVKAARDKIWLLVTRDSMQKSELLLLFSDKRVGMAEALIKRNKPELGVATLEKSELYLKKAFEEQEKAVKAGTDTASFLLKLSKASLKHKEILEGLMQTVPEDAKPIINKTLDLTRGVHKKTMQRLEQKGIKPPTQNTQN